MKLSVRKVFFWAHLLSGLVAGAAIAVMALTGVVLAFKPQLTSWAEREVREVSPAPVSERRPLEALIASARASAPGSAVSAVTLYPGANATVAIGLGGGGTVRVDPFTGEVLSGSPKRLQTFFRGVEDWHRWLGVSAERREPGKAVTGASNLLFFLLGLSGLYLWWPRPWTKRNLGRAGLFGGGLRGKARDWNWHNVAGVWSSLALIAITGSGVVMSYRWASEAVLSIGAPPRDGAEAKNGLREGSAPMAGAPASERRDGATTTQSEPGAAVRSSDEVQTSASLPANSDRLRDGAGAALPPSAGARTPEFSTRTPAGPAVAPSSVTEPNRAPLDALFAAATAVEPGWEQITLRLGGGPGRAAERAGAPLSFQIRAAERWPLFATTQVTVDPSRGTVLKIDRFADATAGRKLRSWLRFLHTGEALGWPGQLVAALASASALLLVWTGVALALRRYSGWRKARAARA